MGVAARAAAIDTVRILTEEYPPYNYVEGGELKGISVEILLAMLKNADSSKTLADIEVLPWSRGYYIAQKEPRTMLFCMLRTPEREKMFKWVGPLFYVHNGLVGLAGRKFDVESIDDLHQYRIGVIRDDASGMLLLDQGVPSGSLDVAPSLQSNMRKLLSGRIDLFAYDVNSAFWAAKRLGAAPTALQVVFQLDKLNLYYAFSLSTPDEVIQEMQLALEKVKGEAGGLDGSGKLKAEPSELERILARYGNPVVGQ